MKLEGEIMEKKTPLHHEHEQLQAHIVDFYGWQMPMHYGSQVLEHRAVRGAVGMFDVSHMTIVDVQGSDAKTFLQYILANDVAKLDRGQACYTLMLNDQAGILDDLIVYNMHPLSYRLVLNAATKDKDLFWIKEHSQSYQVDLKLRDDLAMLAIQGPAYLNTLAHLFSKSAMQDISALKPFHCLDREGLFVAATGYTGEKGVELFVSQDRIVTLWKTLIEAGVQPCGLGARDTLRLEAGMHLYGQDMDEQVNPLEANLSWTVAWTPAERRFVGREALELIREQGISQRLVGIVMQDKGVLRSGMSVTFMDQQSQTCEGTITSGTFSPTLGHAIALVRAPLGIKPEGNVNIRKQCIKIQLTTPYFVKNGQSVFKYKE